MKKDSITPTSASRRLFLGGAVAASAAAVLWPSGVARARWCSRQSHPFVQKRCYIDWGKANRGDSATLRLLLECPDHPEFLEIARTNVIIEEPRFVWDVRFSYNHPELTPGRYIYTVDVQIGAQRFTSTSAEYELRPKSFGV